MKTRLVVFLLAALALAAKKPDAKPPFSVVEATIPEMQAALREGRVTSRELVQQSLARIATYEDKLHAAITVNPNALKEAGERDAERKAGKGRGPLHGIPIAIKDNIHTTDMPTTGGALAFAELVPPYEATLTKNLCEVGAIIPSVGDKDPQNNLLLFGTCTDMDDVKGRKCSIDLAYGMERDFNAWLKSLGDRAPVKSLQELRDWNNKHQKMGAIKYGQSLLDITDAMDLELFKARYEADRARDVYLTATHGIYEVTNAQNLDALLFPGGGGANVAARPGYPTVIVPWPMVPNAPTPPFPDTFKAKPQPLGVSFTGMACSEPALLRLAYAFEQATKNRVPTH